MAEKGLTGKPPSGFLLWLLRMPLFFYRIGLGGLMGKRFILIEHIGRKSGKTYETVVEIVNYDPSTGVYNIASGWGYSAQWYRNLMAKPDINIQVGRDKMPARAEMLSPEAGATVLLAYQVKYPMAAKELGKFMGFDLAGADEAELIRVIGERLPILALHTR